MPCLVVGRMVLWQKTQVCLKTLINLSCVSGPSDIKPDELNDSALQVIIPAFEETRREGTGGGRGGGACLEGRVVPTSYPPSSQRRHASVGGRGEGRDVLICYLP